MARNTGYFAPLVNLPIIVDAPGDYLTRGGEQVYVHSVSIKHEFACDGCYSRGAIMERWHRSGRLYADMPSQNDIVSKA